MIVFDLACTPGGHVFEIWFGSSGDYEDQKARQLISCPYCGSMAVDKAVMAPNVGAKGNQRSGGSSLPVSVEDAPVQAAGGMPSPEQFKEMVGKLAELQSKMLEGSHYVGGKFAEEARAMHFGEQETRPIHGETSTDEAKALIEDGIPVAALPLPVRRPSRDN